MTTDNTKSLKYGVLNLSAALEAFQILQESPNESHKHLCEWLAEKYLEDGLRNICLDEDEPLGRRIKSSEDLGTLVYAYSNARAQSSKMRKRKMKHELYFFGQQPDREAAVEAGNYIQSHLNPKSIAGAG